MNAPGRKVVWIDDAVGADGDAWVKERGRDLTRLVHVDESGGLNEEQVRLLLDWART